MTTYDPNATPAQNAKAHRQIGPKRMERMETFLSYRRQGMTVEKAMAELGLTESAYKQWRKDSEWFYRESTRITMQLINGSSDPPKRCPLTPEIREKYFREGYDDPINPKHLRLTMAFINSLQGGEAGLVLFPPEHAKTAIGEDWLSCAIADDAETREAVVSKTQPDASVRQVHIRDRMTDRDFYREWIDDYGPFKPEGRGKSWSSKHMTVAKKTPRERDYSLQSLGIGSQIQGKRLDKVLVDDIADDKNFHDYVVQARYIRQSVYPRLNKRHGVMLVIGTRQDEMDVYRHLMDEGFFDKVLVLPAVFEERTAFDANGQFIDPDAKDGREEAFVFEAGDYLWPERYTPEEYATMEKKAGPRIWNLTFQQKNEVTEGVKFPLVLFENCYNPHRAAKVVPEGNIMVGGLDPSASNYTSAFALGVDRQTELRTWVDVWNESGLIGDGGDIVRGLRQFILDFVDTYGITILGLERNSTFVLLSTNLELRVGLAKRGCVLLPLESTGTGLRSVNAVIEDMSIEQMSTLFANGVHQIPTGEMEGGGSSKELFMKAIRQFMRWRPKDRNLVRDMVKACQMAEAAAKVALANKNAGSQTHMDNPNLPAYLKKQQKSVPINGMSVKVKDLLGRERVG